MRVGRSWEEHQSRGVRSKIRINASLMCCSVRCFVMWMHRSRNLQWCVERHNGLFVLHNLLILCLECWFWFEYGNQSTALNCKSNKHVWLLHAVFCWSLKTPFPSKNVFFRMVTSPKILNQDQGFLVEKCLFCFLFFTILYRRGRHLRTYWKSYVHQAIEMWDATMQKQHCYW